MKRRGAAAVLLFLFSLSLAGGQEAPIPSADPPQGGEQPLFPIPLSPLLEIIAAGEPAWRPDWPLDFPPDAFSLPRGRAVSITLDSAAGPLTLSRDPEGRLREFPFFSNGAFIQVKAVYGPSGGIQSLSAGSPEDPWRVDFSGGAAPDSIFPGADPVRVNRGGAWYFVLLRESGSALSETWYDGDGNFRAFYTARVRRNGPRWRIRSLEFHREEGQSREDYDFDNEDHITGVSSPRGEFTALYRAGRPRYWNRRLTPASAEAPPNIEPAVSESAGPAGTASVAEEVPENFVLQWDENGFLVGKRAAQGEGGKEFRYEYDTDDRGAWVRRRTVEMTTRAGVRVPLFRQELVRHIEYPEE